METVVFGSLNDEGLEVVERLGRLYVRYDAGAHQSAWREDEITCEDFVRIRSGRDGEYRTLIDLQRRITVLGDDPYRQNWVPPNQRPVAR